MHQWRAVQAWGQAARLARRKWRRIPLWTWARAGLQETERGQYDAVTPEEAARVATGVLLTMAERARAAEAPPERRNRDVDEWGDCVRAARSTWPDAPAEAWETLGDLPARDDQRFWCSQNELACEVEALGLNDPKWSWR